MDQVPALGMSESSVEGEIEDANSNSVSRRGHGKEKHRTDKAQTGIGGSQGTDPYPWSIKQKGNEKFPCVVELFCSMSKLTILKVCYLSRFHISRALCL